MIIANRIECKKCGDVITSKHRHDFKWCGCNEVAVDGGIDYMRRIGDNYIDRTVYADSPFEEIREVLYRNGTTLLKDMSNNWLINCVQYEEDNRPDNTFLPFYKKELKYRLDNNIFIEETNPEYL